jgi:preprotein translocase subunit SecB
MSEEATNEQQFNIEKIYVKDVSFESPNSPGVFGNLDWKPEINVQLNSANASVGENLHEVVLTLTVTAKHNEKTAFLVEIKQAGLFLIKGFDENNLNGMLGAFCPETLFPFAREVIASLVNNGGFPQLMLAPINFTALYEQHIQQQQTATAGQDTAH